MPRSFTWLVVGTAGNGFVGAAAARVARGERITATLRATGNGTFVAFAVPFVLGVGRVDRRHWWTYAGTHAAHATYLVQTAKRHRGELGAFSSISRYGGALGYTTIAMLGLTSYTPGATPAADRTLCGLHRLGERVLFGLYGFTLTHGYLAKGRNASLYGPLAALWLIAAARGRSRWNP